jgi:hypothetical protein
VGEIKKKVRWRETEHKKLQRTLTQSNESNEDGDDKHIDEAVLDDLNRGDKERYRDTKTKNNSQSSDVAVSA